MQAKKSANRRKSLNASAAGVKTYAREGKSLYVVHNFGKDFSHEKCLEHTL